MKSSKKISINQIETGSLVTTSSFNNFTSSYNTRFLETGQEVPLEIKQQRLDIKNKYNNLIEQINNE